MSINTHPELQRGQLPEKPAHVHRAVIADERLDPEILARFVPGDPIGPALHCMQSLINEHLHQRASPRLLWEQSRDRLGLYIVPEGLIGALWLQFARAVERDAKFQAVPRVRHLVRDRPWPRAHRQAVLLDRLSDQGLPHAAGGGSAAARRGTVDGGHRPRARERSRHRARLDRAQGRLGRGRPRPRPNSETGGGGVGAHTSFGIDDLYRCLAGANPLAPDLMTADERLSEVAQILAAGLVRLRRRE